jgi:hypothetical protein
MDFSSWRLSFLVSLFTGRSKSMDKDLIDDLLRDFHPLNDREMNIFIRGSQAGFEFAKAAMTARLVYDPLHNLLAENSHEIRNTLHLTV